MRLCASGAHLTQLISCVKKTAFGGVPELQDSSAIVAPFSRKANDYRKCLPMPWMRPLSTGAKLCRVRHRKPKGRCDGGDSDPR